MIEIVMVPIQDCDFYDKMAFATYINQDAREAFEAHWGRQIVDHDELGKAFTNFLQDYFFNMVMEFNDISPEKFEKYLSKGFGGICYITDEGEEEEQ